MTAIPTASTENTLTTLKDEFYSYDHLNRLTSMGRGDLNANKDGISDTPVLQHARKGVRFTYCRLSSAETRGRSPLCRLGPHTSWLRSLRRPHHRSADALFPWRLGVLAVQFSAARIMPDEFELTRVERLSTCRKGGQVHLLPPFSETRNRDSFEFPRMQ